MTSTWGNDALSTDAFLGGRLQLRQPLRGYRAGVDSVLLAAAVPAQAGEAVLELGCGAGAALFCLGTRVPGLALAGVELQPAYADLARANAALNGLAAEVWTADLRNLPPDLRNRSFHHILANPPYFDSGRGSATPDEGRETALRGDTPLADWIAVATRRLRPKGQLTLIQRADRLPEILAALTLGSVTVLPVAARVGREADRVILQARKDGRGRFRLLAPLILHEGPVHGADAEDYTESVRAILRDGYALALPA